MDLEKFFFDVERKFNKEKRGSAVDVDIFANKASPDDEGQLEHLEELVGVAINLFSSTGHVKRRSQAGKFLLLNFTLI